MIQNRNNKGTGKIRNKVRQKMSYKMILYVGIPVAVISVVLIIFFQFFRNETIKAEKRAILTQDNLPVELVVDEIHQMESDTNQRNGIRYKIAKQISVPSK